MRPQRLVMEGFLAYRRRTEVDFTDADLFVLSGPTGSGKSSVIDGMTFALYGTIPRLDDRRKVAPVISAQADRARVSFEFTVGGESYVAARLVERRGSGATTTEASLERGPEREPLARGGDEVTGRVAELLGLSYDHFTKAVVLPQGAFADFLTDKPKDRQALLRALLDIELFEQIMQRANLRARSAEAKAQGMAEALGKLEVPGEEQLEAGRSALERILEAAAELPSRNAKVERAREELARIGAAVGEAERALARLQGVRPPEGLEDLDRAGADASARVEEATKSLAIVEQRVTEVDELLAAHPPQATLEAWRDDRRRLQDLVARREALDLAALGAVVASAVSGRDRARAHLERLRVENAAHALRAGLVVGDVCPVCETVIEALPDDNGPSHEAIDRAAEEVLRLEAEADEARDRLKVAEGQATQIDDGLAEIAARLADAPSLDEVEEALPAVGAILGQKADLEAEATGLKQEMASAMSVLSELGERASGLRQALVSARDMVTGDEPPIPGDDVVEAWRAFEAWRVEVITRRGAELAALLEQSEQGTVILTSATKELGQWLEGLGVEPSGSAETDLALATERRRAEVAEMERTLADAEEIGRELALESARAGVASALGHHLKANNFEAWLLEEAMETLVRGANLLLRELSAGAYSLVASERQFEVIDHRNADLTRTTRGLSGGEVFLVSLSLALSMADQLAELTGTTSRLESVLLDEGFGSLDQESLDVVASVLDELVGRGRTVGIVTHVRELAERIPVRFEVSKGPESSSVTRSAT